MVKAARTAEGISQQELADHMHKSLSTIKAWERPVPQGSEPSNLRDVSRLLKFLKIPAEVYIHCEDEPAGHPIQPYHLKHIKLLDKLSPRQRAALTEIMESMVEG